MKKVIRILSCIAITIILISGVLGIADINLLAGDVASASNAASPYVAGDVNGDGKVNVNDLIRLSQYLAGWDVEIYPKQPMYPVCGHIEEADKEVAPTCVQAGKTEGKHCVRCGEIIVPQTVVPATGEHIYGEDKRCTVCGKEKPSEAVGLAYKLNADGESYSVVGIGTCTDTDLVIPASFEGKPVTSIGNSAFQNQTKLTSVKLPEGVLSIEDGAFYGCASLSNIEIPDSITSIGGKAFYGCTGLIQNEGGVQYVDKWIIHCDTSVTAVSIRNGTVGISDSAFSGCTELTSVTIGNSVTSIGNSAFSGCTGLTSITIPNSVTSIGSSAFRDCTGLTVIKIPDSVISIGNSAFYNCRSLARIKIPEGVTSIEGGTFLGCTGLASVIIPDSVKTIGSYAFSDCTGLTSITYVGTEAQWNAITKGSNWDSNTGDYTVYFASGNYYLTTQTKVIENDRFVLTIGEGCYVPLTIEEDYLRIMDEVEKATGLSFDSEYARQRMAGREEKRVLISVRTATEIGWAAQNSANLCVEGLLEHTGQYMNVAHELTHVINYLNGNMIARVFAEGMTTYTEKVFEDKKIVFYPHCLSDNYIDETLDTMTAENAEALFRAQYETAYHEQSVYSYGFRMFHFLHESGLYDEYLNMIQYVDTLTWDPEDRGELEFLPYDLLVAQVKAFLGEDFFEVFGEWHRNNVDRFTTPVNGKSTDMSSCPSFSLFPIGRSASMCYANYEFTYTDQMTIDFSDGIDYAEKAMGKKWLGTLSVEVTYAYFDTTTDATIAFYDADGVLLLSQKIPEPWDTKFTVDGATKIVITGDGKRLRFWPVFEDMFE